MIVQCTINDRVLSVEKGTTILQAARQNGIEIPTLCDYPELPPAGSCRICVVEAQGKPVAPTACTTPVEDGMVIHTHSEMILSLRRELFQMLLAEHPACCFYCPENNNCDACMVTLRKVGVTTGCSSCPQDGQCSLHNMVDKIGLPQPGFPVRYRMLKTEKYDPFFDRDYNLCILCGRCIHTCESLHFTNVLAYSQRGAEIHVGTAFNQSHIDAGCSFCGTCVEACPTGALSEKTRKWDGIPDAEVETTCPLCSIGCRMRLLVKNDNVIGSLPVHNEEQGSLCVEGRFGFVELLNHPDRLTQPQRRVGEHQLKIEWDEAIQEAAEKISSVAPDRFKMVLSPDLSNEDLYIAHKFSQKVKGASAQTSSVLPYSPEDWDLFASLLKQSQPLPVLNKAGAILSLGFDGRYAQSVVEVALHHASGRGASLVTVNPFEHSFGPFADEWLRPEPGEATQQLVHTLAKLVNAADPDEFQVLSSGQDEALVRAAQILRGASNLVILVGPEFLTHLNIQALSSAVQSIMDTTGAKLILLPQEGNLAGALLFSRLFSSPDIESSSPELTYLIGVDLPVESPVSSEFIYQNISQPSNENVVQLILSSADFSETSGTSINHANRIVATNQAVKPSDAVLPNWEIICRIARQMGLDGFDFTNPGEIRAEIEDVLPGFQVGEAVPWDEAPMDKVHDTQMVINPLTAHSYMGQPLQRRIAGLNDLYSKITSSERKAYVQYP